MTADGVIIQTRQSRMHARARKIATLLAIKASQKRRCNITMPCEEKAALKRSHNFLVSILPMRKNDFRKMNVKEFEEWRLSAYACVRHFPFDYHIDKMYEARGVPIEERCGCCGMAGFHKMDCGEGV